MRVGVAAGPAITRGGDWFGSPVNLASRLLGDRAQRSVLTTEGVRLPSMTTSTGPRPVRRIAACTAPSHVSASSRGYVADPA